MAAYLTEAPKFYEVDTNGDPLASGKVYTYISGTNTPLATYVSSGGAANTNPVILDSAGRANIWLLSTSLYRFEVYDSANVLIYGPTDDIGAAATLVGLSGSGGSSLIGFLQAGSGAVTYPVQTKLRNEMVSVKDFGATGDGTTNDAAAIQLAINYCKDNYRRNVYFPYGIYAIGTQLTLSGSNKGITLIGEEYSSLADGSVMSCSALKWTGGASDMIASSNSFNTYVSLSFYNTGTGLTAIHATNSSRETFYRCGFRLPSGATKFSTACVHFSAWGYIHFYQCEFDCAPGIRLAGIGTTLLINGRCVFDSAGSEPHIYCTSSADIIDIHDNTFNMTTGCHVIFDSTNTSDTIGNFHFHDNEVDGNNGVWDNYVAILKNVKMATITDNRLDVMGSNTTPPIQLYNSSCVIARNTGASLNDALIKTNDATSFVYAGIHALSGSNGGIIEPGSQSGMLIPVTYAASPLKLLLQYGDPMSCATFVIAATNNSAFTIQFQGISDTPAGFATIGQQFIVRVKNSSGGAMGVITFESTQFNLTGAVALVPPANGSHKDICFQYDGVKCMELWRSTADIANA